MLSHSCLNHFVCISAELPGPADYDTAADPDQIPGGRFNTGRNKSELDWIVYYAKEKPGRWSLHEWRGVWWVGVLRLTALPWYLWEDSLHGGPYYVRHVGTTSHLSIASPLIHPLALLPPFSQFLPPHL